MSKTAPDMTLTGSIFVNSDKIQLWQHKVTPFPVEFWAWFGSLGTKKWSRNIGLALYFSKLLLEGEIGQNLVKLWMFKVQNHAMSVMKFKSSVLSSPLSSHKNDLNGPKKCTIVLTIAIDSYLGSFWANFGPFGGQILSY